MDISEQSTKRSIASIVPRTESWESSDTVESGWGSDFFLNLLSFGTFLFQK